MGGRPDFWLHLEVFLSALFTKIIPQLAEERLEYNIYYRKVADMGNISLVYGCLEEGKFSTGRPDFFSALFTKIIPRLAEQRLEYNIYYRKVADMANISQVQWCFEAGKFSTAVRTSFLLYSPSLLPILLQSL